jgi:hypothetical protein
MGTTLVCFRGKGDPLIDGSGRVLRTATAIEGTNRVRVEFENVDTVEMSDEEFWRYRAAVRLAGRN